MLCFKRLKQRNLLFLSVFFVAALGEAGRAETCSRHLKLFGEKFRGFWQEKKELGSVGARYLIFSKKVRAERVREDRGLFRYRIKEEFSEEELSRLTRFFDKLQLVALRKVTRVENEKIINGVSIQQAISRALSKSFSKKVEEEYNPRKMPLEASFVTNVLATMPVTLPASLLWYYLVERKLAESVASWKFDAHEKAALAKLKKENFVGRKFTEQYFFESVFLDFVSETFAYPSNLGRGLYFDPRYESSLEDAFEYYRDFPLFEDFYTLVETPEKYVEQMLPGVSMKSLSVTEALSRETKKTLLNAYFEYLENSAFLAAFADKSDPVELEWSPLIEEKYSLPFFSYENAQRTWYADAEKVVMEQKKQAFWDKSFALVDELEENGIRFEKLTNVQKQYLLSGYFYLDFLMVVARELDLVFETRKQASMHLDQAAEFFSRSLWQVQGLR